MTDATTTRTTVFQSGNSQAVRLPKGFRFTSKTVEIFRRCDEVVLREKPRTMADLIASLPPITRADAEEIERALKDVRDSSTLEERHWDLLSDKTCGKTCDKSADKT